MIHIPLPFDSALDKYETQAEELLTDFREGRRDAVELFHRNHPRFLDPAIPWLPLPLPDAEIRSASLDVADARLAVARWYCFRDWSALAEYVGALTSDPAVRRFEAAVGAVIAGDLAALRSSLAADPNLVKARSTRVTKFDPSVHRATLLHYVAANGVEDYRQKSPANAVEVARTLLDAGGDVDALADMYGGQYTTMSMLVSSTPPFEAGVQIGLVNTLLDYGAAIEGRGSDKWGSPLVTALIFGSPRAAEALAARGARVDNIVAAAGLGRTDLAAQFIASADAIARHRALALAAQLGHAAVIELLLDSGENPDRYNPEGTHSHTTPLHQAALAGHAAVVRLLIDRGARLDIKDTIYNSTPLAWAEYAGQRDVVEYLRSRGAPR